MINQRKFNGWAIISPLLLLLLVACQPTSCAPNCVGIDFQTVNQENLDMAGVDLSGANFQNL
ncbi:MAG: hypothetical protein AAF485_01945, partial [Chloroflexota bacterium]